MSEERLLTYDEVNAYIDGKQPRPMTQEEREWCIKRIIVDYRSVFSREQLGLDAMNDTDLAYEVAKAQHEFIHNKMGY